MKPYTVSYDLRRQRNYQNLYDALSTYPQAVRILESIWLLTTSRSAVEIRNHLSQHIDGDNRLFVAALTGEAAWSGLLNSDYVKAATARASGPRRMRSDKCRCRVSSRPTLGTPAFSARRCHTRSTFR